jgi:RNA polymerase sigma-70 factor (ECF subfamily)
MHTTPLTLLERLRDASDSKSWERFVALYTPFLFYWARRLHLHGAEAADLVQDVFVKLVQELPKFTYDAEKGSFRGWLRTLCIHRWSDLRKKRENRVLQAGEKEIADVEATDDGLEMVWAEEYDSFLIRQAMKLCEAYSDTFDSRTLVAFREVAVNQRSVQEVAREMGLTENAVSLAKLRVIRRLRLDLSKFLD